MQHIANRLGMTKGNLYHYFTNKHEILFHCRMKAMQRRLVALDEILAKPAPRGEKLHALLIQGTC